MLKLFKAKSLKSNTKTGDVTDNRNAKKQRGRSMVEMLGVLAIIGVLSIGGISGYTLAMRRYRANEILNVLNKYALALYTSCQNQAMNNPLKLDQHGDPIWNPRTGYEGAGIYTNSYGIERWLCNEIRFTDAGLGAMPSELNDIYGSGITRMESGDVVAFYVRVKSKEMCQTLAQLINEVGQTKYCSNNYDLSVYFIMN